MSLRAFVLRAMAGPACGGPARLCRAAGRRPGSILRSKHLMAPLWRQLLVAAARTGRPAGIDVNAPHGAALRRDPSAGLRLTWKHPPRRWYRPLPATRRSASAGPHMPGLDPNCHEDADEALRIASGCIPRAHGRDAADVRPADGGLSQPGASAPSWPIPDAGGGLSGPGVHRACSRAQVAPVPSRGNAPRNSSPNRTEADR